MKHQDILQNRKDQIQQIFKFGAAILEKIMLQHDYLLILYANIGLDTAENELPKVCKKWGIDPTPLSLGVRFPR